MSSFARSTLLWLAAAPVKAQDELAALGLTAASPAKRTTASWAKENIRYELTQPQIA
jgi:hypothetical protein